MKIEWGEDNVLRHDRLAVAAIYEDAVRGIELRVCQLHSPHVDYFFFPKTTDMAFLRRLAERMAVLTRGT